MADLDALLTDLSDRCAMPDSDLAEDLREEQVSGPKRPARNVSSRPCHCRA